MSGKALLSAPCFSPFQVIATMRIGRRCFVAIAVTLLCGWFIGLAKGGREPATPDAILNGDCAPCMFQEVVFGEKSNLLARGFIGQRIRTRKDLDDIKSLAWIKSAPEKQEQMLEQAILWRDGNSEHAVSGGLARYNQCAKTSDSTACRLDRFPLRLRRGDTVALVFTTKRVSGFAGWHQSWKSVIRTNIFAPRFGAVIRSERPLHAEGDLMRSAKDGSLRYVDRGFNYYVASTAGSWSEVALKYGEVEDTALRNEGDALLKISTHGARQADEVLAAHWLWIRRNMRYRRTFSIADGGMAPSAVSELMRTKEGDCKDFALVLRGLLARDGIEAQSVWVDAKFAPNEPSTNLPSTRIDHVILFIPSLGRYVDPTLASKAPIPTGGRLEYPFAVNTSTGRVVSIKSHQTQ